MTKPATVNQERLTIQDIKPEHRACANCCYFEKYSTQKKSDNIIGACKANPPQISNGYDDNKLGQWPTVLGTFWCGMFGKVGE